ncbi:uncharacterized protein CC84DRAFT_1255314 [Paraphaeosphaeria sporulosa]|uniref:Uncharacterized protein n=1 Tax=Paraphaeosphaeria sporulosa TaxID=1460663 RepID=A0A177CR07_9PLEO|nr:uncharacterized protein CC84DRAFT_1255314 [Paraphaeosphaeria sporulosa]OAG09209.1 hypothetical protein CC84DRAFT_1255314 [Paraphaeosphaeria sporulosa]
MERIKKKASRVFKDEEKKIEPAVEPNFFTVRHDRPHSAGTQVALWEAQKPLTAEPLRKVVKKKSSILSLRTQKRDEDKVVTTDAPVPPVPPIPAKFKYSLFPQDKPLSPFDVAARLPSSEQRPDTAGSGFGSRAVPHPKATVPSKFQPIATPYSKPSSLRRSPSKVIFPSSSESSASAETPDTGRSTTSVLERPPTKPTRNFTPIMTPWSNEKGLPESPRRVIAPVRPPWSNEPGLPESPPKPVPWPGGSRSPSPASSVRTTVDRAQYPSKETTPRTKPFEGTTFGVPDEDLRAMFKDHPDVIRCKKMFEPGGKVSSDIAHPPGIPAAEYHKMKALYDLTGSPFNGDTDSKGKSKGKKPQPLQQASSAYSLKTVTPFSVHEHAIPRSAPLDPPLPFRPIPRSSKSEASSPTTPDFANLSTAAERKSSSPSAQPRSKDTHTTSTSGRRSGYTPSSLGRSSTNDSTTKDTVPSVRKLKSKKSLRSLFQRDPAPPIPSLRHLPISNPIPTAPSRADSPATVPGSTPKFTKEFWERDTLISFPIPLTDIPSDGSPVPGLPRALFKHTKRAGPPPIVPARPGDGKVDLEIVRMRGVGDGRMVYVKKGGGEDEDGVRGAWVPVAHQAPPGVDMGIKRSDGEVWERFSHERYGSVERIEKGMRGMVVDDFVFGEKEFVEDI